MFLGISKVCDHVPEAIENTNCEASRRLSDYFYAVVLSALISGQDKSQAHNVQDIFPASYSPICYIYPLCYMLIDLLFV
jgi:hypothetical protein